MVYLHSHTPPIAHRDLTARNILIDSGLIAKIADLGVAKISLFTLTQTFPKDLKPPNYRDPVTRRVLEQTEIERREHYIQAMQADLGETHPLVKLTLDCLVYDPEDRPSAVEVLRQLEEVGQTVPGNCTETKLELIQQIGDLITRKEEEIRGKEVLIQQIQLEHQRQLTEYQAQLRGKEEKLSEKEEEVRQKDRQLSEKEEEVRLSQRQFSQKDRQLSEKDRQLLDKDAQIKRLQVTVDRLQLSGQLRSLELQPREEGSQGSRQSDVSVACPKKVGPICTTRGCTLYMYLLALRYFSVCLTVAQTLYAQPLPFMYA